MSAAQETASLAEIGRFSVIAMRMSKLVVVADKDKQVRVPILARIAQGQDQRRLARQQPERLRRIWTVAKVRYSAS
jgi:hypothetical protein